MRRITGVSGPVAPSSFVHSATGVTGPTGPTGTIGPITGYISGGHGPLGATGAVGPSRELIESLHHVQDLPFGGKMECVKEGFQYGIVYVNVTGRRSYWIAIFEDQVYKFPEDLTEPWQRKFVRAHAYKSDSDALVMSAIWNYIITNKFANPTVHLEAPDLFEKYGADEMWSTFLEEARKTFVVGEVMTS